MRPAFARIAVTCVLLAGTVLLAGCNHEDLHQWVAQEKAKKGEPLPPLPVIKTFETFVYQDQDKRDPFAPGPAESANAANASGPHPEDHVKGPLEYFPLDSLKMVGTIGEGGHVQALIKDPQGVIHRVLPGEYMGENNGHVTDVTEDHVDLVELVSNGAGGWMERDATVALGDK